MKYSFCVFFSTIALLWGCDRTLPPVAEVETGERGMVVSAHPLASEAGAAMLKKGGNAVDAAVATAFAISVVEPFAAGIGGGGFLLLGVPPDESLGEGEGIYRVEALDFRERAPKLATRDMYLDPEGKVRERSSLDGHLAVGVPGTVAGLFEVHRKYGSLPWEELLEPAVAYARDGFEVSDIFVRRLEWRLGVMNGNAAAREIFTRDGAALSSGDLLVQGDKGRTLEIIGREPQSFYRGEIAEAIAADMAEEGGLVSLEDLRDYRPIWREPVCGEFREVRVCAMSPPSSGGVHAIEILNIIGDSDLREWGRENADTLHLLAEAMRVAYADRAEFLGDPDFVEVPVKELTSREYGRSRRSEIELGRARPSAEVKAASREQLESLGRESEDTTHLTVVDGEGLVVSMTYTLNGPFGAAVVVPGTGILLNNEMDDFAVAPGVPNLYGLVGTDANAVAAGKTPLSSMTPLIATRGDRLVLAAGSPGGSRIITTVLQIFLNAVEFGMDVEEAVSAPRIHHQWLPDELSVEEGGFDEEVLAELRRRGHKLRLRRGWGNANAIVLTEDGLLEGAADPRGEGEAISINN
ncbi:MAG: gamma-glutamyltransferase [Cyanobacteriota bacterium]|nr:gamma-glutamyltransferase [Cyanobacteriota bacterium]